MAIVAVRAIQPGLKSRGNRTFLPTWGKREVEELRSTLTHIVTGLLMVMAIAGSSDGVTYHVSPHGSNTPPYDSFESAARHPYDAILAAEGPGDTVLIHTGTYSIDSFIGAPPGLVIVGVDRDSAELVWDTFNGGGVLETYGDLTVTDLTFRHVRPGYDPDAKAISIQGGNQLIKDCRFDGMEISAGSSGIQEIVNNEFLVRHGGVIGVIGAVDLGGLLKIHDNYFRGGVAPQGGTGVIVLFGDVIIENNTFDWTETGLRGLPLNIDEPSFGRVIVRNNVIVGGQGVWWYFGGGEVANNVFAGPINSGEFTGGYIFALRHSDTLVVRNNVFCDIASVPRFQNECGQSCPRTGPVLYIHNAFWPLRDSFAVIPQTDVGRVRLLDSANFSAWPMFADSVFRLQYSSPLIDAGDPLLIDPDGTRSDIGGWGGPLGAVYEYVDLPPQPPMQPHVAGELDSLRIEWASHSERDLAGHRVYRGALPGFWTPQIPVLFDLPWPTHFVDDRLDPGVDSAFYVITAYDSAGQASPPSLELRYKSSEHPANRAPEFDPISDQTLDAGDTLRLDVLASDPDGDPITLAADGMLPTNSTFVDLGNGLGKLVFSPDSTQIGENSARFVASDGTLEDSLTVSIVVEEPASESTTRIVRVYPNPLKDAATVEVEIRDIGTNEAQVEIVVIDLLGRRVAQIYQGPMQRGKRTVTWNLETDSSGVDLASGVYFVLLRVEGRSIGSPYKIAVLH